MRAAPVIGLTGGIASGKTTVSNAFAALGASIVDTDVIAREVVSPGSAGLAEVVNAFGQGLLAADGSLDRRQLRGIVFADASARARLEHILHPRIRDTAQLAVARAREHAPYVVLVVPLLTESGQYGWVDRVLVVDVPPQVQQRLLMARDQIDREMALAMVAAQASREARLAIADEVIRNSGGVDDLIAQATSADRRYRALGAA